MRTKLEKDTAITSEKELVSEQVIRNIQTINTHQDRHHQNATTSQRVLDRIAAVLGRPRFLYFQLVFFTTWIVCSHLVNQKILPKNFPLFDLHLHGLEIASLLISTEVLIYQTRQEELNKERAHLALQLNLLTEQKIAKLISLVEELRTDLPNVNNREDRQAEIMKQATDPQAILEILQNNLEHPPNSPLEHKNHGS